MTRGIVIAGTCSGSGKTTVALSLMAALVRRGLKVAPFKVGPDFIDPGHHRIAAGRTSINLDGWMLSADYCRTAFARHAAGADVAVVEGVMGLFDGASGNSEAGSTAQMAKWLNLPVLLVVDAASMARSAAALVQGFERFDADLRFAGVLFNRLGSRGHLSYLNEALDGQVTMPCLGGLLRDDQVVMPERHLGLVTAEDHPLSQRRLDDLARRLETGLDLEGLLAGLPPVDLVETATQPGQIGAERPVRIGVAKDRAFCFYYPDNLDLLAACGAAPAFFSPLDDATLPADLDGLYFGGGYPELYAEQLAANRTMRQAVAKTADSGMPIYGECGGFMYLCRRLIDTDGQAHDMTGCFDVDTAMQPRLRTLGYRQVDLVRDTILGPAGQTIRGHEFHYSDLDATAVERANDRPANAYRVTDRSGRSCNAGGFVHRRTLGSYIHLHWGSCPAAATALINACRTYQQERKTT